MIGKLREGERLAADGMSVAEVARALEISEQGYSRWRNQYGGMEADDAKELCRLKDDTCGRIGWSPLSPSAGWLSTVSGRAASPGLGWSTTPRWAASWREAVALCYFGRHGRGRT